MTEWTIESNWAQRIGLLENVRLFFAESEQFLEQFQIFGIRVYHFYDN